MEQSERKRIFWVITTLGLLLPWLTGIGVKLFLDATGRETVNWSYFFADPFFYVLFVPISIFWAAPYIFLAFYARDLLSSRSPGESCVRFRWLFVVLGIFGLIDCVAGSTVAGLSVVVAAFLAYATLWLSSFFLIHHSARLVFIGGGLAGGISGTVTTFVGAWEDIEVVYLWFFWFPVLVLESMAIGLTLGYVVGRISDHLAGREAIATTGLADKADAGMYVIATNALAAASGLTATIACTALFTGLPGLRDDLFGLLRNNPLIIVTAGALAGAVIGFAIHLIRVFIARRDGTAPKSALLAIAAAFLPGLLIGVAPGILGERVFLAVISNDYFVYSRRGTNMSFSLALRPTVAASPDGTLIAADVGQYLHVWDADDGDIVLSLDYEPKSVWSTGNRLTFSPDGSKVAVGSHSLGVLILDVSTGERLVTIDPAVSGIAETNDGAGIAFSPDGQQVAIAFENGSIGVYRADNGELTAKLQSTPERSRLSSITFSRNGQKLAVSGVSWSLKPHRGFAEIWDTATKEPRLLIAGHDAPANSVSFSADGEKLLTAGYSEYVRVWNAHSGAELITLEPNCRGIFQAKFMPDDKQAVLACGDGSVHICGITDGQCTGVLYQPLLGITAIDTYPDGVHLVIADRVDSVSIFNPKNTEHVLSLQVPGSTAMAPTD